MTRLIIKCLTEDSSSLGHLHIDGMSGLAYLFLWDKSQTAFTYAPKSQAETDDIFATSMIARFPHRFSPVLVEDGQCGTPRNAPAPYVARAKYASMGAEDLVMLCADCGFAPEDSRNKPMILAQLDAFMLGRAWAAVAKPVAAPVADDLPE